MFLGNYTLFIYLYDIVIIIEVLYMQCCMNANHSVVVSCLQLALEQVRGHFQAVYDLTIYYEGYGCATAEGGRTRGPPPDLFGGRS